MRPELVVFCGQVDGFFVELDEKGTPRASFSWLWICGEAIARAWHGVRNKYGNISAIVEGHHLRA